MVDSKDVWDKIAPSWDEFRKDVSPIISSFLGKSKGRVLDLGCGSGRNFVTVKEQKLYAVDFSSEMIKIATKNAEKMGVESEFFVMEANKLSFDDNYFDSVLFWAVLHCIKGKKKRNDSFKEIYRVLKHGGRALISTWGRGSHKLKNKDKECMMPWSVEGVKQMRYTYIYDVDELKNEIEKIGFEIEKIWEDENINLIVKKK